MVIAGQIKGTCFSLVACLVQHKEADLASSLSASHMQTKSQTPQNLLVSLWKEGEHEEMSSATAFWMHSGLELPLIGTAITQPSQEPLADVQSQLQSASALVPFLPFCLLLGPDGGTNPTTVWVLEHFAFTVPWEKQGRTQLRASPGGMMGAYSSYYSAVQKNQTWKSQASFIIRRHKSGTDLCWWRQPGQINEMYLSA